MRSNQQLIVSIIGIKVVRLWRSDMEIIGRKESIPPASRSRAGAIVCTIEPGPGSMYYVRCVTD